jgi:hypothetical protein
MDPGQILEVVKDNVIVQWFLVVIFILTVGTSTAEKIKGPVGAFSRWVRSIGAEREEREARERRETRRKLLQAAAEGREYVNQEIESLKAQVHELYEHQDAMARIIREHMAWDFDRVQQLIHQGVRPGDIPTPPPLRVPWLKGAHRSVAPAEDTGTETPPR